MKYASIINQAKPTPEEIQEQMKQLKPGGYLLAILGAREYPQVAVDCEDLGLTIHPFVGYFYTEAESVKQKYILVAQKPVTAKRMTDNIIQHGCGAMNIDGCRVVHAGAGPQAGKRTATFGTTETQSGGDGSGGWEAAEGGRFPANLIHDGSPAIIQLFPTNKSTAPSKRQQNGGKFPENTIGLGLKEIRRTGFTDQGSAARFFQKCADIKSLAAYLEKLTTPENQLCLLVPAVAAEEDAAAEVAA